MLARCLAILAGLALASCQANDGSYLLRGPGYELNAQHASISSSQLFAYMKVMCRDAGLSYSSYGEYSGCPGSMKPEGYQALLQAGYNEIDLGCRQYIQIVFEARVRESQFKSTNSLIQAFISGVFTLESAGPKLFSYLVLSSSAANAFYDASMIDPLQSMTIENIMSVVEKRQQAFSRATAAGGISSQPQVVRAWREYQWLCTPISINSDFNALAAAGADGRRVDFDADALRVVAGITGTVKKVQKFNPGNGLEPAPKVPPADNAVGVFEKALSDSEVKKLQSALCTTTGGGFGPATRAAINAWRTGSASTQVTDSDLNKGLGDKDVKYLLNTKSCASLGYKSAYERAFLYDSPALSLGPGTPSSEVAGVRAREIAFLANALNVSVSTGATTVEPPLRDAIRKKRKELNLKGDYIDQEFLTKLDKGGASK
ncbi:hypothetical protein PH552_00280 [Rhizobium sp. CNPSo 3968]|uniref:hypothetical protein n=1 Tax=Rhizobium sp. CNPSo 3968 TaxID=3021408 RepID=UPI00254D9F45|nr:hypothetical protein [Rhizobium sp. CNPSo 3968]MDK4717784.1 hypothetical protein [Rhizobium sp. CNPSo 3968]